MVSRESVTTINFMWPYTTVYKTHLFRYFMDFQPLVLLWLWAAESVIKSFCYQPYVALWYIHYHVDAGKIYDVSFCGSALECMSWSF